MVASFYPIITEAVEYYGKFPPTVAYSQITVNDTIQTVGTVLDADSYSQNLNFGSDGSILINVTQGFP